MRGGRGGRRRGAAGGGRWLFGAVGDDRERQCRRGAGGAARGGRGDEGQQGRRGRQCLEDSPSNGDGLGRDGGQLDTTEDHLPPVPSGRPLKCCLVCGEAAGLSAARTVPLSVDGM